MQPYMHRVGDSLIEKGTLAPNRSAAEAQDYHTDTRTALYISEKIIEKVAINQTRTDKHSFIAHDNTSHIHNVCIRICMYVYIYISYLHPYTSSLITTLCIKRCDSFLRVLALIPAALAQDARFLMAVASAEYGLHRITMVRIFIS